MVRFIRSTWPLVQAWLILVSLCSMPFSSQTRSKMRLLVGYVENANDGIWTPEEDRGEHFNEGGFHVAVLLGGTSWDKEAK
jgi:hypothetical protein